MKLIVVQKDVNNLDLLSTLDQARQAKPDLVCYGELAVSGCLYEPHEYPPIDNFVNAIDNSGLRVSFGTPLRTDSGLRNCYIYRHQGKQQEYFKVNLFPVHSF